MWRGSPARKVLEKMTIAVVAGTTTENWLKARRTTLHVDAEIETVPDYRAGLQKVLDHEVDVFFGERTLVLGAMDDADRANLVILDRLFTHEPAALRWRAATTTSALPSTRR